MCILLQTSTGSTGVETSIYQLLSSASITYSPCPLTKTQTSATFSQRNEDFHCDAEQSLERTSVNVSTTRDTKQKGQDINANRLDLPISDDRNATTNHSCTTAEGLIPDDAGHKYVSHMSNQPASSTKPLHLKILLAWLYYLNVPGG